MSTSTTALLPLDPAISPEQVNRILPIRTNLLPEEITAHRNARRTRVVLAGLVVLVALLTGGWYVQADKQRDQAGARLATVTGKVDKLRKDTRAPELGPEWTPADRVPATGWALSSTGLRFRVTRWQRGAGVPGPAPAVLAEQHGTWLTAGSGGDDGQDR